MAEYSFSSVLPTTVSSSINTITQPKFQFPSSINPVNTALDPAVLNVGVRITNQKYLPISSEWIQTTYTCTEVNFWLYYGTGEIGEIAGVALRNLQGISKYIKLKGEIVGEDLILKIYAGSQVITVGTINVGWNIITFGLCNDYLNANICQKTCSDNPDSFQITTTGDYVPASDSLYFGCMSCTDSTTSYIIYSLKVIETNQSCVFSASKYAMTNSNSICGDGVLTTEACDDGNLNNGDGCSDHCALEAGYSCYPDTPYMKCDLCGNGNKVSSEGCDDHNLANGDGCSSTCIKETGWACTGGTPTTPDTCIEICGDGLKFNTVTTYCDDGNNINGDGCDSTCTIETGWTCTGGSSTSKDACVDICGDGKRFSYLRTYCDDGNTNTLDGCDSSCNVEVGWACGGGSPTTKDYCGEICGDGIRYNSKSKYCDDGNYNDNDGCSFACEIEDGWTCSGGSSTTKDICNEICGDGKRFTLTSTFCDDGNSIDSDGCSSTCSVESGFSCTGGSSSGPDTCSEVCGDGIRISLVTTFCDDGNKVTGDGCDSICNIETGWSCVGGSKTTPDVCVEICGDGKRFNSNAGYCDDGNKINSDGCSSTCSIETGYSCTGGNPTTPDTCTEICGDGIRINALSTYCDDNNILIGDGCSSTCSVELGWICSGGSITSKDICTEQCGDGRRFNSITTYCDDANIVNGDGCSSTCSVETGWTCSGGNISNKDTCTDVCGDGMKFTTSTSFCEDGNSNNGDGCSLTCSVESGWSCSGGSPSTLDTCSEICGDSKKFNSLSTYCDDGNNSNNDGCSSTCAIESGWTCSGGSTTSIDTCTEICGDGKKFNSLSTYCDDGNLTPGDGCDASCNVESGYSCTGGTSTLPDTCSDFCGDGKKFNSLSTYCDDGNNLNGDGCSSVCAIESGWVCSGGTTLVKDTCSEICGDGKRFNIITTYCDDGNLTPGDGCSSTCTVEAYYTCTGGNSLNKDTCTEICGDGVKFNSVYCDDNNVINNDGCSSSCSVETGWTCSGGSATTQDTCTEICGDGIRFNSNTLYCDDGNLSDGDGCSSTCSIETYYTCSGGNSISKDICKEICGDGVRINSLSTYCDDYNTLNGDGCNMLCNVENGWTCSGGSLSSKDTCSEICGDGKRFNSISTYCDDGNSINGDGCSSSCSIEAGWSCSGGNSSTKDTCIDYCGDGIKYGSVSTSCDDGNMINNDGCSSSCSIETGWTCSGGTSTTPDLCTEICGDGKRFSLISTYCDDGNLINNDGCDSSCQVETGWTCSGGTSSNKDTCIDICGDSKKYTSSSSFCDDGNTASNDGCSSTCVIESGWICSGGTPTNKDSCTEICGDSKRFNSISTYCDDGNLINNDGCNSSCNVETGWSCTGGTTTNKDTCRDTCGDGLKYTSSSTFCDDGNVLSGDGCSASCAIETGWACSGGSITTKDTCVEICGDSKRFNILSSYCDDGNTISNDGCSSSCSTETGWICFGGTSNSKDACTEICGDGIRFNALSTYCDDGNSINGDGCNSPCTKEAGWTCSGGSSSSKDTCIEICGDGKRFNTLTSYCDDGNTISGDGCSSTCIVESGHSCTGGSSTTKDTCSEYCGDGTRISTFYTYCDDGNLSGGDGCNTSCGVEIGWSCADGTLTTKDRCTEICGDGIRMNLVGTYCDDGNNYNGDGCSSVCSVETGWKCIGGSTSSKDVCSEICGDGIKYNTIVGYCDDKNNESGDGCSSTCNIETGWICSGGSSTKVDTCSEICGDGIRFNSNNSYCDDGNLIDGDGCSSKCKVEWKYSCRGGSSSSKDICTTTYSVSFSESNAMLSNQIIAGSGAVIAFLSSVITMTPFLGIWALINQFQMLLLILLTGSYLSDGVKVVILGMDFTMLNFNFIQLEDTQMFGNFFEFFSFDQAFEGLYEIGVTSGNTFINVYKLLFIISIIALIHTILYPIIVKCRSRQEESKWRKCGDKLLKIFTFAIYIRLIFESFLVICLSVASEISLFIINNSLRVVSLSISLVFCAFLFIYSMICWYQIWKAHPDIELTKQYYFTEYFSGLKNSTYARMFPAIKILQRICCSILLIFGLNMSINIKLPLLTLIHLFSTVYFLVVRPYEERKELLIEAIDQMLITFFTGLLIHFNEKPKWSTAVSWIFISLIIMANVVLFVIILINFIVVIKEKLKKCFEQNKIAHISLDSKADTTQISTNYPQEMVRARPQEEYKSDVSESDPALINIHLENIPKPMISFVDRKFS